MAVAHVLVSGAAGGIGRSTARLLSQRGMHVFAGVLNDAESASIAADGIPNVTPVVVDVTREASVDAALEFVSAKLGATGGLTGLVNNAGVNWNAPLQYLTTREIRGMIEVNFLGAVLMTRAALPLLRRGSEARVVFTGSAMGLMASPTVSTYCGTKFALEGFSDGLRLELDPLGIRVSLVEPGVVRTPMTSAAPRILDEMLGRMTPEDRGRYEGIMRKIVDMSAGPKAGIEAEQVAATIVEALTSGSPKARYQAGVDSKAVSWLRHLPDRARDALQRKMFGM